MPLTGPTMTPTVVIPPFNETVAKTLRVRPMAEVTRFGYALELLTEAALTVKAKVAALDPAAIDVAAITYSQSSVYSANTAATNAGMTDGSYNTGTETGTNGGADQYIKMDFGAIKPVANVIIGCDFDSAIAGGWDKTYTENCDVEISDDDSTWTLLFDTGTFSSGIQTYPVTSSGRYIRILPATGAGGYVAVTEFYATSD
jgi:hypothetical protein